MSVINTNVNAIIAQNAGIKNSRMQTQAMQQLSTGSRINSASDDAAGLAISSKMTSQVKGLNQAVRNANDGISLIQTAEGALTEVTNMLQRMRELAVQSASDTNTSSDRTALNAEFTSLRDEINRIGNNTQFNGMNVLDKSFVGNGANNAGKFVFQVGANAAQTIDITLGDYRTTGGTSATVTSSSSTTGGDVQKNTLFFAAGDSMAVGDKLTFTMTDGPSGSAQTYTFTASAALAKGSDISAALAADTNFAQLLNLTPTAGTNDGTGDVGELVLSGASGDVYSIAMSAASATSVAGSSLSAATFSATTQVDTLTFSGTYEDGAVISIDVGGGNTYDYTANTTDGLTAANVATAIGAAAAADTSLGLTVAAGVAGTVTLTGAGNQSFLTSATVNLSTGGDLAMINTSDITSQANSNSAVTAVDSAIAVVSGGRATMGATINRLNYAADNLLATSSNVSAARSRVQDTDYSQATTELARTQIIQQASTAMLAQANQSAQSVLSLLK